MENTVLFICLVVLSVGAQAQAAQPVEELNLQERRARAQSIRPKLQALADQFEARTFDDGKAEAIPYRLFKPQIEDAGKKLPLVVYFHGRDGRGRDNRKQISGGSLYGSRIWALPENQALEPCYILAPQLLRGPVVWKDMKVWGERASGGDSTEGSIEGTWTLTLEMPAGQTEMELVLEAEGEKVSGTLTIAGQKLGDQVEAEYEDHTLTFETFGRIAMKGKITIAGDKFQGTGSRIGGLEVGPRLNALIEQTIQEFNIDRNRLYVTGQSGGGANTWGMLSLYPNLFAAAIPLCGRADVKAAPAIVEGDVAIWVFHGTIDHLISVEASREMVAALKQSGGEPRYTEFPGVKHDVWVDTFPDPALHKWLFEQRRQSNE